MPCLAPQCCAAFACAYPAAPSVACTPLADYTPTRVWRPQPQHSQHNHRCAGPSHRLCIRRQQHGPHPLPIAARLDRQPAPQPGSCSRGSTARRRPCACTIASSGRICGNHGPCCGAGAAESRRGRSGQGQQQHRSARRRGTCRGQARALTDRGCTRGSGRISCTGGAGVCQPGALAAIRWRFAGSFCRPQQRGGWAAAGPALVPGS